MSPNVTLRPMEPRHWSAVRRVYAEGLATGIAAFMLRPPIWKMWNARHETFGRFVAEVHGEIVGFAALTRVADA